MNIVQRSIRGGAVALAVASAAFVAGPAGAQPQDSGRYGQQYRPGGGGAQPQMKLRQVWSKDFLKGYKVTATFNSTDIRAVLRIFYEQTGLNFIITENARGTVTGQFNNVPALEAIVTVLRVNNLYFIEEGTIVRIVPPDEYKEDIIKKNLVTRVFDMNQATPKTLLEALAPVLTDGVGKAVIDAKSNKIVITDLKDNFEQLEFVLREFSAPGKQVYIDIKVVSIDLTKSFEHGVNWSALGIGNYFKFSSLFGPSTDSKAYGRGLQLGFNKATGKNGESGDGLLSMLATRGDVRVLTSPKILAAHGEKSKILIGRNIPYVSKTSQNTTTLTIEATVSFVDAGIVVEVTPNIGKDNTVRMQFKVEVSTADTEFTVSGTQKAPLKTSTTAETFILADNGALIVLGGLFENSNTKQVQKIPLLGDIPLIGSALFSWSSDSTSRREIALLIQPTIVDSKSSAVRPDVKDILQYEK